MNTNTRTNTRTRTYENQANLPRLPIPTLPETTKRFLECVQPLLSPDQYAETKVIVKSFLSDKKSSNAAPALQALLEVYDAQGSESADANANAASNNYNTDVIDLGKDANMKSDGSGNGNGSGTPAVGSYIEEFWNDAYLAPDASVVMNLNPFFLLEDDPDAKVKSGGRGDGHGGRGRGGQLRQHQIQITRASSLAFNSLKFAASLKNEQTKPDIFKGTALCMDQFRSLFGSCRVPKGDRDMVEVDVDSDHVVVLYRNQFYYFRALWTAEEAGEDDNGNDNGNGSGLAKVAVSEADIQQILTSIVEDGNKIPLSTSIQTALGAFTTLPRKAWAKCREQLIQHSEDNASAMEVMDSALFVLVLDDYAPENIHDAAANMLHGTNNMMRRGGEVGGKGYGYGYGYGDAKFPSPSMDTDTSSSGVGIGKVAGQFSNLAVSNHGFSNGSGNGTATVGDEAQFSTEYQCGTCCNRWYDKLQIIVCSDGSAGINFEHSAIDGHTALRFASDVYAQTVVSFAKSITKSVYTHGCPIPNIIDAEVLRAAETNKEKKGIIGGRKRELFDTNPKKIDFDIAENLKDTLFHAEATLGDALDADASYVLEFTNFGKNLIVGNKLSPDSVVQMSIILAYYRLYGEIVSSYEPVLTKAFYHGRTEAMRSTTMKAANLCKCWMNRMSTKNDKLNALRDATKYHSKKVKEAIGGNGVDRHLYALKCIGEKNGLPPHEFFKSDAWKALNHTILSTSNCGNPALRLFGFGPVTYDGFGIGYIIKDNGVQYAISSKHRQTRRYAHAIHQTLCEIGELLEPLTSQELGHHRSTHTSKEIAKVLKTAPAASSKKSLTTSGNEDVQFADGWDDTYGDTIQVPPSPQRSVSSSSSSRFPSGSSFVGISRQKTSTRNLIKKVGKKISDRA